MLLFMLIIMCVIHKQTVPRELARDNQSMIYLCVVSTNDTDTVLTILLYVLC